MSSILIAAAVYDELSSLVDVLEHSVISPVGRRQVISGRLEGKAVRLIVTGPGLVNTVQALTAAVENSRPAVIIQTGCAGAFKEAGLKIGDIGIATEEIDVHLGIEPDDENQPLKALPFPLFFLHNREFKNRYPLDAKSADLACNILTKEMNPHQIHVQKGPFITVSTITASDRRAIALYERFAPCMESMEGSGAAHLSIHYELPFLEIRAASNLVGKRDRNSWNLPLAFKRCVMAVRAVVKGF